jgi:hypothetical protein
MVLFRFHARRRPLTDLHDSILVPAQLIFFFFTGMFPLARSFRQFAAFMIAADLNPTKKNK